MSSWKSYFLPTLNMRPRRERIPAEEPGIGIPRLIHQTHSGSGLPDAIARNVQSLKELNPGWDHRLYSDEDRVEFISTHYPDFVLEYYHRINPSYGAARADFFRYLLLYKLGGVYLDIKSTASRPLDSVLRKDDAYILSQWRNEAGDFHDWGKHYDVHMPGGEFQQWHIICAPRHPFLKAVIEYVLRNIDLYNPGLHGNGKFGVLRVTGPIAYTAAIAPLLETCPYRRADAQRDLGLEYSIFRKDEHTRLFPGHYSELREPIVELDRMKQLSASIYGPLRQAWSSIRRLKLQPSKA